MSPCELTLGISALACIIAENLCDEDLELAAIAFTQLGDSLGTISVQRNRCNCTRPCCPTPQQDSE
ncbi:MAG: DUF6774 domain-containing protein [Angelakisella sp.]|nr:DUF6774 domain-containing protein [Angelakisella sp.]